MKSSTKNGTLEPDLAEFSALEKAFRESEYRYRKLLDAVTDYIYTVHVHQGVPVRTVHGPGCVAITGYCPEEYEADRSLWFKMICPDDLDYVMDHINRITAGESVHHIVHRIIHKEGSIRWIKHTPVQHFDGKGNLMSYEGLITDITEHKKLKDQLYQSQKMESIGRLAGGMAHDFNNYLTAIIGLAELTQMKMSRDAPAYKNLGKICDAAMKAANITRQLLAFSRKQMIEPKVMNLNDSIREFTRMLGNLIGEHIELAVSLAPDLGCVKADPTQIEQIIINLAVNARDAISSRGSIKIETANVEVPEKETDRKDRIPPGRYVRLSFTDSGSGIPEDIIDHIFEPFFTTKKDGKGTGLGLSTVYGIVEQNRGEIRIWSRQGEGTRFEIYLPMAHEKPDIAKPGTEHSDDQDCSATVLVVDDAEMVRNFAVEILQTHGFTAYQACNGLEALEFCRGREIMIDLIITDIVMPKMGGKELIDVVKSIWKGTRVLYMSGYADDSLSQTIISESRAPFISKPFASRDLMRKVREALST